MIGCMSTFQSEYISYMYILFVICVGKAGSRDRPDFATTHPSSPDVIKKNWSKFIFFLFFFVLARIRHCVSVIFLKGPKKCDKMEKWPLKLSEGEVPFINQYVINQNFSSKLKVENLSSFNSNIFLTSRDIEWYWTTDISIG